MVDFAEKTDAATSGPDHLTQAALVGAGLREVRERLGWKLPDVADRIRIRSVFLNAIESGDLSSLPGTAYRVGFVRTYAQALGLDGEEILQRFRTAGQIEEPEKAGLKLLVPVPDRGVPKGALILIAFIIAIGGYGLWYYHTEQTRKVAQNALQIPAKLQPLAAPPKVTPPPATASDTSGTEAAPTATTSPVPAAASSPVPAAAPAETASSTGTAVAQASAPPAAQPDTTPTAPAAQATPVAQASTSPVPANSMPTAQSNSASAATQANAAPPAPARAVPAQASATATGTGLVISATQPSWIQVTAPNGTILFSKVLNAGQSWPVPQMPNLKMTTGNAGGTVISVNGKPGQPLGAEGAVLHGYQLTPPAQGSAAPTTPSTTSANAP